ncbi:MAG: glycine/betaine ABC transporter ATP-binding protein [bacterium]|nr:MAG: glycine/betaine ABC transporter ATP-binding protein [bacterium]
MTHNILEFQNISFQYPQQDRIFQNVSFTVSQGEVVVILGLSGSGKSTILKLANRLIELSEGEILYNGQDIKSLSPLLLRKNLGYLSQIPYLIEGNVRDNLLLPFSPKGKSDDMDHQISPILAEVGLNDSYLDRPSKDLSVGEKQRVALARTLLNRSKVLLLDEPNSSLDEENSRILIKCLKRIIDQDGITIVMVTHQLDFARSLGGRYLLLTHGTMKEIDDPKKAFTDSIS